MIKYEIEGGSLPVVICYPEAGQTLCTERGSMSWMSISFSAWLQLVSCKKMSYRKIYMEFKVVFLAKWVWL